MVDILLGRMFSVLIVAAVSMATVVSLMVGVQGLKHFGWNWRRGLGYWNGIVAALIGTYIISGFIRGGGLRMETATGLAIGLVVGVLLATRARRPTNQTGSS